MIFKKRLEVEFKSNQSIKVKGLKFIVKKYCNFNKTCKLIVWPLKKTLNILVQKK